MRAVVCSVFGPIDLLTIDERPDPSPAPGNVVVAVRAAGVNFVDGLFVQGKYQIKPELPFVPGGEVAGEVVAIGEDVEGVAVGDRVLAMPWLGGFASHVELNARGVVPVPDTLSYGQAAGIVQSYGTMLYSYTRRITVQPGDKVLVLGAGGGIGLAAVDLAKQLGATVIAAASSDEKLAAATAAGADATINYETEDLKARARELSGGGVDIVVDPVGDRFADPALRALGWMGRYLVIGFAGGAIPSLPINQALLNNRSIVGVDWGAWTMRDPAGNQTMMAELLAMAGSGAISPVAPTEYPL
ncbi:MAG: NADPH:quinone oxidoreductase family protein, partial [Actinomycetota bacterium]|nr:NADPH:quinone oxidoreductase family protein [Actinomycetota bacterium]